MPRHPPCALTTHNKINTKEKNYSTHNTTKAASCAQMLASTIQFSHTTPTTTTSKRSKHSPAVNDGQRTTHSAARDTQQRANIQTIYLIQTQLSVKKDAHPKKQKIISCNPHTHIRCMNTITATPTTHNCGSSQCTNKNSLERR